MKTVIAGVNHYSNLIARAGSARFRLTGTKIPVACRLFALILLATVALRAPAMVFTGNTEIGPNDTNYDGQDIVILDCTVSIDGPHTFSSLVLAANGVLTHSASPNGEIYAPVQATNQLVLNGTTPDLVASNAFSLLVTDTNGDMYTNGSDYLELTGTNDFTYIERTTNSSIPDGGTVLVSYTYDAQIASVGLDLTVTGIVWVTSGCEIDADGLGFGTGSGPGAGASSHDMFFSGSGGGDGGCGGMSLSNALGGACYDAPSQPGLLGSGGGSSYAGAGGNGAGLVRITAGDEVEIDGVVSANGYDATNSRSGGGSGGGIFISTPSLSGVGSFSANGGSGVPDGGGGGGGGHIAIACGTNNFTGTMTAYGGGGVHYGGAGTIFTETTGQTPLLTLDNNSNIGTNSTVTLSTTANVSISGGAILAASTTFSAGNVVVGTNSALTFLPISPTGPSEIHYLSNLTIEPGGLMFGYVPASTTGPGSGFSYFSAGIYYGGGAGYGGRGGAAAVTNATGGTYYGTVPNPSADGSYGGGIDGSVGGAGGGAIALSISGTLLNNGTISANGGNGAGLAGGGGSGGSVDLEVGTLSGNGSITANGGAGANGFGGGGGGGRIGIVGPTNNLTGPITAYGGGGANYGGPGTVFLESTGHGVTTEKLIVDNDGNVGPTTVLLPQLEVPEPDVNLIVQNGASASFTVGELLSLTLATNGWLTAAAPADFTTTLTVLGSATIQPGCGITFDSLGFAPNTAETGAAGYSASSHYGGGGGGNGGFGGASEYNLNPGGLAGYNNISEPEDAGGGGGGYSFDSPAGYGGGALSLHVSGTLLNNGSISANGGNGAGAGGGGGAGGSLTISAGFLAGSGSISVNGGNGANEVGGGGGGGCIALTFATNLFTGTLTALGGMGANIGGAGTIYYKTNSAVDGQILVDNDGQNGAGSAFVSSSSENDLTLRDAGTLVPVKSSQLTFGNVIITNSSIIISNGIFEMTANNLTLQNGGGIIANAGGYPANQGSDPGTTTYLYPNYPGGGGGNGGCGGSAISNSAAGGGAYGEYSEPIEEGSGGGGESPYSIGGMGGGVIELTVYGALTVSGGTISANGGNGSGSAGGGGAGGSLDLVVGSLTGSGGVISANGGSGANGIGGGGGGGIIGISLQASSQTFNFFGGAISAYGGPGGTNGGAGTILIKTNYNNTGLLIVDNGGNVGTNTPIYNVSSGYNLQVRNGAQLALINNSEFLNVLVTSNAWIEPGSSAGEVEMSVIDVATINAGGGIIADSFGSAQNSGSAPGRSSNLSPLYACSGAGHGGDGGFAVSNSVPGGGSYDSPQDPFYIGSGGGGYLPNSPGGSGGGLINLQFPDAGALQLYGVISANGGNGSGTGGGGGSGGSITIDAGSISGTGSITANGGNGAAAGGGGGGGLITVDYTKGSNFFAGTISAYGGGGANYGGAGLVYSETDEITTATLLLDNDGNVGTNTPLSYITGNVTVQNGAIGAIGVPIWNVNNILVRSNSTLTVQKFLSSQFTVDAENLTIAAGGAFTVDGDGSGAGTGSGAGLFSGGVAGGGGHGGYGGDLISGGYAYDSIQFPEQTGSGGANSSANAPGGSGGGNVIIEVISNLVVNGRLSANGISGGVDAGGGSGGSIYLEQVHALSGSGVISANGGASHGVGGGGAGGRIALFCASNYFTGQFSASGGAGGYPGGAGTIFTRIVGAQTLVANNGGIAGANTPLSTAFSVPTSPFDLDISGGATVVPLTPLPLLSNLNVSASSTLTMPFARSNLVIGVINNANIAGDLDVDYLGYSQSNGPGAGASVDNEGSGGGYGGAGGASESGAPGGLTYGSATTPNAFGSGGGNGADTTTGGSAGGGALRLSVLGTLAVSGNISANGDSGLQDDSGGGSGGSVWISAGTLSGAGTISAYGGDGVLYGGGGGGGGRIAIYAPTNQFTGTTNVSGGLGIVSGKSGTLSLSSLPESLQVVSQSPTGLVMNTVGSVNLTFSDMLNATSVSASDFTLVTPAGPLAQSSLSVAVQGPYSVQLNFPIQNLNGTYTIQVAAASISDLFGQSLATPYSGSFAVSIPTISGTVTDTNGAGVAGVTMQPSGGLTAATTDSSGNYSLGVPTGWTGTVTPSLGPDAFIPASMSYTNIAGSLTGQNYSEVPTISPSLTSSMSVGNCCVNWTGISGVTYQVLCSTNLVTWQPLGSPVTGTNGPMQFELPTGSNAQEFFQIQVAN